MLVSWAQASTSHSATGGERYGHRPERLLAVLHRWRDETVKAGRTITRIALAFEAGRHGFWLARWLAARGVEAHVIHPSAFDSDARAGLDYLAGMQDVPGGSGSWTSASAAIWRSEPR
jgi:hypothetical protein